MSAEKFFSVKVLFFWLRFGRCSWFCMVFCGLFSLFLRGVLCWFA